MTDPKDAVRQGTLASVFFAAFLAVTLLMRGPVTQVGPLSDAISSAYGLGYAAYGFLAALPIFAFGAVSFAGPAVAARLGLAGAVALASSAVAAGCLLRGGPSSLALFAGTFAVGAGIALLNVLMPVVVKSAFTVRQLGTVLGIYTGVIGLSGAVGGLTAVPIANLFETPRATTLLWGACGLAVALLWCFASRGAGLGCKKPASGSASGLAAFRGCLADKAAWAVTGVMGLQSTSIYVVAAWLPAYWMHDGLSAQSAGGWLFVYLVSGLPASIFTARFMELCRSDVLAEAILSALYLFGIWAWWTGGAWMLPGSIAAGAAQGAMLSVAFLLMAKKTADARSMLVLSGFAQGAGYLAAGTGPWVFGLVLDATGGYGAPFILTAGLVVAWALSGLASERFGVVRGV